MSVQVRSNLQPAQHLNISTDKSNTCGLDTRFRYNQHVTPSDIPNQGNLVNSPHVQDHLDTRFRYNQHVTPSEIPNHGNHVNSPHVQDYYTIQQTIPPPQIVHDYNTSCPLVMPPQQQPHRSNTKLPYYNKVQGNRHYTSYHHSNEIHHSHLELHGQPLYFNTPYHEESFLYKKGLNPARHK